MIDNLIFINIIDTGDRSQSKDILLDFEDLLMLKKLGFIVTGVCVILYIFICLILRFGQTKLIFQPDDLIKSTPEKYNLYYEDVWIAIDQEKIHGWWIPYRQKTAPVLLYFHGNGSNNGDLPGIAAMFNQLKLSVLLIDYRGYGKSSPRFPNETRVYEDADAAWEYLTKKRQIKPQNIFIYGHSLGGAIAINLAIKHPQMAGLITEGTFTSMKEIAGFNRAFRLFPLDWIITQRFDSITKIKSLQTPLLIFHGSADQTIPAYMAQKLFNAAPEPKQLVIIPQATHTNLHQAGGQEYFQTLQRFIQANSEAAHP